MDDGMTEKERAIAWVWAIEALASFKQVDIKLLHDIIEMAPALPDDMGTNAKERVALRCLEGFLATCTSTSSYVPSAQHSKITFDSSESCENVLKRIVDETPESDLKMAGPGLLKWDIEPFIMHKRASLPKCALQQLKDSILDGTHPHADFLRARSGLTIRSGGGRVPVRDSSRRFNESSSNTQNMGVKENSDPPSLGNESKQSEKDPDNENVLSSKRDRIASDAKNMTGEDPCSFYDSDDSLIKAKKKKQDASSVLHSTEQNQIPLHGKELLEDFSERERCDLAEKQMGMMKEGTVSEDDHVDLTASKRRGQNSGDKVHKSQSATLMHQDTFGDGAKDDGGVHPQPRTSVIDPLDGTHHKVSDKALDCISENDFHIKALHPSADGPKEKNIDQDGNGLATKNLADEKRNNVIGSDDCCVISKNMKWDASFVLQSIAQKQIPLHGSQLSEESSERDAPFTERSRRGLAENQMGMMDEGKVIEDDHEDYTASKRSGQSTDDAVHNSQSEDPCNAASMPLDTFQGEAPQYTHVDEANDKGGLHPEPRLSCVAAPDETQNNVSAKVFNCNSEQDFHIKVPQPATANEPQQKSISEHCTEPRISVIASLDVTQHMDSAKASDSSSEHDHQTKEACHASADGSQQKTTTDEANDLLEWLCYYDSEKPTDDIDEFHDEKIEVAMKSHAFLSSQCSSNHSEAKSDWTEKNLCKKYTVGSQLLMCKTSNCPVEVHENWLRSSGISYDMDNFYCPFCSYSVTLKEYLESKKESSLLKKDLDAFIHTLEHHPEECIGKLHNKENICTRNLDEDLREKSHQKGHLRDGEENIGNHCEEHVNEVNDLQLQNINGNKKQVAPSASCIHVSSECGDESATTVYRKPDVSTGEKEREEKVVQECISVGGLNGCPKQVTVVGDILFSKNTESLLDLGKAVVIEQENLQQHSTNAPEEQGHELNIDSERDDDHKSSTSNYSNRLRKRKSPCSSSYPRSPQLRRIKVPWSTEEEEILKKAVQKFSSIDERNIPWKQILEFGASVFLHTRTTVDLKDKWRNIRRRKPKLN